MSSKTHHPSFIRLVDATIGVDDRAAIADMLGQSQAVINNWATRSTGVSKDGALLIEQKTGVSPTWILTGVMPPSGPVRAVEVSQPEQSNAPSPQAVMLGTMLDSIKSELERIRVMSACVSVIVASAPQPPAINQQVAADAAKTFVEESQT